MKTRTLSLGSVAVVSILLVAAPAFAAGSRDSSPAERAQTNQLNTDVSAANAAEQSNYDSARAAYESSLNRYDVGQATYENDRARYNAQRPDYEKYRAERWGAFHEHDRYRDIRSVKSADLVGKMVSTRSGERLGRIRSVDYSSDGQVNRIAIDIRYNRVAWLYADDVRFDPRSRAIMINLSSAQVDRLSQRRSSSL